MLQQIVKWLVDNKIFARERTPNEVRAKGILLYRGGLSLERTGGFLGVSHEAVREWYQKASGMLFDARKKRRKRIAVDEKEFLLGGVTVYLWAAVDLDDHEKILAVAVTFGRCYLEAISFLRMVKASCSGRRMPRVFVDGGNWYPCALQRLGFRHTVVEGFGPRSAIERFFSLVDHRIRCFFGRFPKWTSIESVRRWFKAFGGLTNLERCLS